jgi:hypothetical protein
VWTSEYYKPIRSFLEDSTLKEHDFTMQCPAYFYCSLSYTEALCTFLQFLVAPYAVKESTNFAQVPKKRGGIIGSSCISLK